MIYFVVGKGSHLGISGDPTFSANEINWQTIFQKILTNFNQLYMMYGNLFILEIQLKINLKSRDSVELLYL